jgi:hypothetical protein
MKVRIENTYSDGHTSTHTVEVPAPHLDDDLENWWDEEVLVHTGDGHGEDGSLGFLYQATIVEADELPLMIGMAREWNGI